MPSIFKVIPAVVLLVLILVLVCGIFLDSLLPQSLIFAMLSLALLALRGGRRWLGSFRLMLPFLLSLVFVYVLFGLCGLREQSGQPGSLPYWLSFGARRILLFVNSVLAFRLFFSVVSFDELLALPIGIAWQKYFILGKPLYNTAESAYAQINGHQALIASEQRSGLHFRHRFKARLAALLALLMALLDTARHKGRLIDNRLLHCHSRPASGTGDWYLILGFTVLVTVATVIVPIPVPGGGFFNFGDVMVVFVGLYAGSKAGALAGGIGSAIADLLLFPLFAPITLLVKGCEGLVCGLAHNKGPVLRILFPLLGSMILVAGYFAGEWFMPQLGKAVALADLPANLVQAAAGFFGGRLLFAAARYLDL